MIPFTATTSLISFSPLSSILPDLDPFVAAEDTDNEGKADEDGSVLTVLSGRLLADDSGDQPLCLFLGGPAFAWVPGKKQTKKTTLPIYLNFGLDSFNFTMWGN